MSDCIHSVDVDLFIPTCLFGHVCSHSHRGQHVHLVWCCDTGFMRLQFDLNRVAGHQTHDQLCIQGHQSTAQLVVL